MVGPIQAPGYTQRLSYVYVRAKGWIRDECENQSKQRNYNNY